MAKPAPKPAPRPAPKPVDKPAPKPVDRPAPAPAVAKPSEPKPAAKPAPKPSGRPVAHAAPKPAQKPPAGRPEAPPKTVAGEHASPTRPKVAHPATHANPAAHAAKAGGGSPFKVPSSAQAEIDLLRGQTGDLSVAGVWTDKNPPKFAGGFGVLLQDLLAGVSLANAFQALNHAAAATRDNSVAILKLVQDHKTPTFKTTKGK